MAFPSFLVRILLAFQLRLKKLFGWLEKLWATSPLTRRQISIGISMLCLLAAVGWLFVYDLQNANSKLSAPFVVGSTAIPLIISLVCFTHLPSIRQSNAVKDESLLLSISFFLYSLIMGIVINKAAPTNKCGLYLNYSFILWGFFIETPLGLKTKMGLVNGGASVTIGFVRELDWWGFIALPIFLAVVLNLFSWHFAKVIFPDEPDTLWGSEMRQVANDLVLVMEEERRQLNQCIMEASRKAEEYLAATCSTLNDHNASISIREEAGIRLGILEKDAENPILVSERERLQQLLMEANSKAKEYWAAHLSAWDAYETNNKTMEDAECQLANLNLAELARRMTEHSVPELELRIDIGRLTQRNTVVQFAP